MHTTARHHVANSCLVGLMFIALLSSGLPADAKNAQPSSVAKAAAKIDCLVLEQTSHYGGEQTIWLAPNAVRTYSKKNHVYVLTKAPDWKVFVFSEKRKVIFTAPLQKWQGGNIQGLAQYFGRVWDFYDWSKSGSQKYAGLNANKYLQGKLKKGIATPEHFTIEGEFLTYEEFKQDPNIVTFLRKLHTVPSLGSIPLFLRAAHSKTDPPKIDLETSRVRREKIDAGLFIAPTKYKNVKLENDVYTDDAMQGLMEDLNN